MRHRDHIRTLQAAAVILLLASCVKSGINYETFGEDVTITPVVSMVTKSVPGPLTGTVYPVAETMGILAFHHQSYGAGQWGDPAGAQAYIGDVAGSKGGEFGYHSSYGSWAGLKDGAHFPYHWPDKGSLIFAGYSPYRRIGYDHNLVDVGNVSFDVAERKLSIIDYRVGRYVPMTKEQIQSPDYVYENVAQSDLMFFMPTMVDGKYVGVNHLASFPARFHHALSMIEFTVRAEDDYDIDRMDLDRVTVNSVYHEGDFNAVLQDDGSFVAEWTGLRETDNMDVFHAHEIAEDEDGLELFLKPRTIAQMLVIPGPAHPIEVVCHIHVNDRLHTQTLEFTPEQLGITEWEMGKRYVYNLILGLKKITFAPDTYEWNNIDEGGLGTQMNF